MMGDHKSSNHSSKKDRKSLIIIKISSFYLFILEQTKTFWDNDHEFLIIINILQVRNNNNNNNNNNIICNYVRVCREPVYPNIYETNYNI